MYKKYFNEYYVDDQQLKQMICKTLESLTVFSPEDFSSDLLSYISPEQDTDTLLQNLIPFVPIVEKQKANFEVLTENQSLRVTAIILDAYLLAKRLEFILLKLIHMSFSSQFLGLRYLVATEIIEKHLEEDLKYNPDLLYEALMNPYRPNEQGQAAVIESIFAEEEIERVCNNEKVSDFFWNTIEGFETSMEDYIKLNLPTIVYEICGRIFFEAVMNNASLLGDSLGEKISLSSEDKKNLANELLKFVRQHTNRRLGIKHGGVREREGFSWTKERKAEFFEMVERIPKIERKKNGKRETLYLWEYIYEQFDSRGHDAKESLKSEQGFELIPLELLNETFDKWERYEETFTNIDAEDSPKMFLFRQALHLLNFPSEHFNKRENKFIPYKRATLQKYYDAGKEVFQDSDNQDKS